MTRKELRDRQDKHDAHISKIGQREAARYLRSKEQAIPPTRGNMRAALALLILAASIIVIGLAL